MTPLEKVVLNAPYRKFKGDEKFLHLINEFLSKGPYLKGEPLEEFEHNFAQYIGTRYCVGVSSGTSALELAFLSLNLAPGTKIGVTANAGGYSSIAALRSNLIPEYIEVNDNGMIDYNSIGINSQVDLKVIVVTNLYGQSLDINELRSRFGSRDLIVIEDCAQSVGAMQGPTKAGSLSDISTYSFYPTKNLGTFGDAGAICTNNEIYIQRLKKLREYGWDSRYFAEIANGSNFRMDNIHAITLTYQLSKLDSNNNIRLNIWRKYLECMNKSDRIIGINSPEFVAHLAVIVSSDRKTFMNFLAKQGVETSIHYPYPDYEQSAFSKFKVRRLEVTENLCASVFSIPLFPEMFESEIEIVLDSLLKWNEYIG